MAEFPNSKREALTMLYLQSQDLSGLTPEDFVDKYNETYKKISKHCGSQNATEFVGDS